MKVPEDWKEGVSKTGKINEILSFLRTKFPEDIEEKAPPSWSQSKNLSDSSPKKWTWRNSVLLLNRKGETRMFNNLTEEEKEEVKEDTGTLEYLSETAQEQQ